MNNFPTFWIFLTLFWTVAYTILHNCRSLFYSKLKIRIGFVNKKWDVARNGFAINGTAIKRTQIPHGRVLLKIEITFAYIFLKSRYDTVVDIVSHELYELSRVETERDSRIYIANACKLLCTLLTRHLCFRQIILHGGDHGYVCSLAYDKKYYRRA